VNDRSAGCQFPPGFQYGAIRSARTRLARCAGTTRRAVDARDQVIDLQPAHTTPGCCMMHLQ